MRIPNTCFSPAILLGRFGTCPVDGYISLMLSILSPIYTLIIFIFYNSMINIVGSKKSYGWPLYGCCEIIGIILFSKMVW